MRLLRRIRDAWRRAGERRDEQWAEEKLAQRAAERHAAAEPPASGLSGGDWVHTPPGG